MTAPALVLSGLTIRDRSGTALVSDIDLTLASGSVLLLIGETGSGKSLIAQAVMGLLPGAVRIAGGSLHFDIDEGRKHNLLNGLDEIGLTLDQKAPAIEAYEAKLAQREWA